MSEVATTPPAAARVRRPLTPYWLSAPAVLALVVLLAVPLLMTFALSLNTYSPTAGILPGRSASNYAAVLGDPYFGGIFLRTFRMALVTTIACALIGTPEAWVLLRLSPRWRGPSLLVVLGPLLISVVVRTLGWTILLGRDGLINQALTGSGLLARPLNLLFTETGVEIALVHVMVPFMVIAVWTSLQRLDLRTEQAAASLGASAFTTFRRVVLPQAIPGILSGSVIVFSLSASAFATPALIGGRRLKVVATTIYDEFLVTLDWPQGAAIACLLVVAVVVIVMAWNRLVERRFTVAGGAS